MVTELQDRGRVGVAPIGTWPSRSAEGCRVLVLTDQGCHQGTILPKKASGHVFGDDVDTQPASWTNLEVRVDDRASSAEDLARLGIQVGDFVAIDPRSEVTDTGFVVSRHLDNKAGVACLLAAAKALLDKQAILPLDFHLLFTIFEEVGSGASAVLHQDVAEMVSIDNATVAPGQNSSEFGVTVAMMDSSGPFDYHLSKKLLRLCKECGIPAVTDVYRNYRCDAASALEAGNDIRTALICFGLDASHHYERTHIDSLTSLARLVCLYAQSSRTFLRDRSELAPLPGFPGQPVFPRTAKSRPSP
jgi:peptidase M42 family hydrolase